ncbi:hypothetical protein L9F63_003531, partial [Diploptera punctata]
MSEGGCASVLYSKNTLYLAVVSRPWSRGDKWIRRSNLPGKATHGTDQGSFTRELTDSVCKLHHEQT